MSEVLIYLHEEKENIGADNSDQVRHQGPGPRPREAGWGEDHRRGVADQHGGGGLPLLSALSRLKLG